jgi:uncharacterized protein (TIGR02266 family)
MTGMVRGSTDERRGQPRVVTEIRIEYRTVGSFLTDYAGNLSQGGLFIQTDNPLPPDSMVRLVFSLPGTPFLFDVSGRVKWSRKDLEDEQQLPGMGVEFIQVDDKVRARIAGYVERLRREHAAERPPPLQRPRVRIRSTSGSGAQRGEVTHRDGRPLGAHGRGRGGEES